MSLLLDTHVVLWWLTDDPAMSDEVKAALDDEPDVFVSAVTVWEVAIKQSIGKLPRPARLPEIIRELGFDELPVTIRHAIACRYLPPIHRDPFDRMLVAQAQCDGLTLVTYDSNCQKYDVPILRA